MRKLLLIAAMLPLAGCIGYNTEYRPYEGKSNVYEGRGGTKVVIDGMEIWEGEPPRKYTLVGIIKDERPAGPLHMMSLKGDVVKEAKQRGGSAVIDMGGATQFLGTISNSFGTASAYGGTAYGGGFTTSMAIRRNYGTYAVIRYLD